MKIAILSRYQLNSNRGAETFVKELAAHLSKDIELEILSGKDSDSLLKILAGKYDLVIPINGTWQSFKSSFGRIFGSYKILITGHSGIGKTDIFNVAVCQPDIFVGLTHFATEQSPQEKKLPLLKRIPNKLRKAKTWAWKTKVVVVPNGVDLNKFSPGKSNFKIGLKKPIILSVGALEWYKHHERTIKALALINNCSLLIVGRGSLEKKLTNLGNQIIPGRFKIINTDYEDLPKIYKKADLFVLPSWEREAFGLVYLEAMATNLAVVAPDDPPRREIIGKAGILTETDDINQYSQMIKKALELDWANLPRNQAGKFAWEKIAARYEVLFKELVNK